MRTLPTRFVLILIAAALVAVACGGDEPSSDETGNETELDPVPWSEASKVAEAPEGEFEKELTLASDSVNGTMLQEWVTWDFPDQFFDRRLGLGIGSGVTTEATQEEPHLRFLYRGKRAVMWNPNAAEQCGTPWVEMEAEDVERMTGIAMQAPNAADLEPLGILRKKPNSETPIENDENGTVYEIDVPGFTGVPASTYLRENPDVVRDLRKQEQSAEVRLPRGEGPIEIEIDLTDVIRRAQPQTPEGATVMLTWTISPTEVTPEDFPSDLASSACLN